MFEADGYSFKTSPTPSHHFFDMVIQGLRPNQSYLWELDVDPVDHSMLTPCSIYLFIDMYVYMCICICEYVYVYLYFR